jgi:hypothetical protein
MEFDCLILPLAGQKVLAFQSRKTREHPDGVAQPVRRPAFGRTATMLPAPETIGDFAEPAFNPAISPATSPHGGSARSRELTRCRLTVHRTN